MSAHESINTPPESAPTSENTQQGQEPDRFYDAIDRERLAMGLASSQPIELEIGSGKGLFLIRTAQEHPDRTYIGMELATKYAREAQEKLDKAQISNAVFLACDAVAVLANDIPDNSVAAVHVYFPDPWWKSKHKKRRVLSDETIVNIERVLKPDGELHFWTDVLDYYEIAIPRIVELTKLQGPKYVPEPPALHAMDFRTHFERRTRLNGLPVYRSKFVRSTS
jgi:tRNA (guanine-N7-)-methyltransferase